MSNLKLIITADDFCYNNERDKGIVDSLVKGALTRTSVMVNALNSTSTHMSQYLDVIKGSIGVHFKRKTIINICCAFEHNPKNALQLF